MFRVVFMGIPLIPMVCIDFCDCHVNFPRGRREVENGHAGTLVKHKVLPTFTRGSRQRRAFSVSKGKFPIFTIISLNYGGFHEFPYFFVLFGVSATFWPPRREAWI